MVSPVLLSRSHSSSTEDHDHRFQCLRSCPSTESSSSHVHPDASRNGDAGAHEEGFLDWHFVMDGDAVLAKNQLNSEKVINR